MTAIPGRFSTAATLYAHSLLICTPPLPPATIDTREKYYLCFQVTCTCINKYYTHTHYSIPSLPLFPEHCNLPHLQWQVFQSCIPPTGEWLCIPCVHVYNYCVHVTEVGGAITETRLSRQQQADKLHVTACRGAQLCPTRGLGKQLGAQDS